MRTQRRRAVTGAIGTAALVLAASACSSDSDDSTAATLPAAGVETTVGTTEAADGGTPGTEAPAESTSPPLDGSTGDVDEPATTEAAVVVPEALQFTAPLVGGGTFDGAAAAGKPTVFWFWAPT